MQLGRWPTHHWDGTEYRVGTRAYRLAHEVRYLADGFYGVLWGLIGDLDYFYKWLLLENHASGTAPCMLCPANLGTLGRPNWRDFRNNAAWIGHTYGHAAWADAHPNRLSLLLLPFVSVHTLCNDYMHCKYLGVDQYLMGSILWYMCNKMMPGGDAVANMAVVMTALKIQFRTRDVDSYDLITVNMFSLKESVKLRGRASEIRYLGKSLLAVFKSEVAQHVCTDAQKQFHKLIAVTLKLNSKLDDILEESPGWKIEGEAYNRLAKCAHDFSTSYSALSLMAAHLELPLFIVSIKIHYLLHICRFANRLHPKVTWCFGGETFMRVSKRLMQSCMAGKKPHAAAYKFCFKYCRALHYAFEGISNE